MNATTLWTCVGRAATRRRGGLSIVSIRKILLHSCCLVALAVIGDAGFPGSRVTGTYSTLCPLASVSGQLLS